MTLKGMTNNELVQMFHHMLFEIHATRSKLSELENTLVAMRELVESSEVTDERV